MGVYLNEPGAYGLFQEDFSLTYYVDKTEIIKELVPLVELEENAALSDNQLGSYWTSSGPYDELFYYIGANTDAVKDDVALMVADNPVPARVQEYAATSMELKTRDEIFSAMVVYGFLNYENGYVSIPNKELMDKFAEVIQRENSVSRQSRLRII